MAKTTASVLCAIAVTLAACGASEECALGTQPDGSCVCNTVGDCPGGRLCSARAQRCYPAGNSAPSVTIHPISRSAFSVWIVVTVVDADADSVQLDGSFRVGLNGPITDIVLSPDEFFASPRGVTASLKWHAAASLGSPAYVDDLYVMLQPFDGKEEGTRQTSARFAFGNDPPVVSSLTVDGTPVSGNAIVRFTLADSTSDIVDVVSIELSLLGDFSDAVTLDRGTHTFPVGTLFGLATSASGTPYSVTWDTTQDANVDAAAARLRLTVEDSFDDRSAAVESAAFEIDNVP